MGGEGGGGDRTIDQGCPSGTATRGKDQGLDLDLDLVRKDQSLAHVSVFEEPPKVVVTQPKGMLCRLDARFALALQPDAVFAIVIDPNNRRVFKNIKEVKLWNVLEDDGSCTVIESVQVTRFNFWFLSGAISTHLHIVQDRKKHQVVSPPLINLPSVLHSHRIF
ncbi:hypothetical protein CBR_g5660 [Chara braunii]|uniref:Uncharacterized protein n=1 Tax=Chara braunii TaxID=69332 RepID=A0A388JRQ4_CHABU|nr:hypothetical protein CBR_g5660 [Chara braunii]|eukprot:GBG60486.1 hypothetical protein CBR_g5660 [Chara braunii]